MAEDARRYRAQVKAADDKDFEEFAFAKAAEFNALSAGALSFEPLQTQNIRAILLYMGIYTIVDTVVRARGVLGGLLTRCVCCCCDCHASQT
eukprot:COSAG05_NODE_5422_length_1178_cov_3.838740_1_plen_92_part_00